MWVGDIDGKGIIYDENGGLILKNAERVLYWEEKSLDFDLGTKWRAFFCQPLYKSKAGDNPLYITNQRIIHIKDPDPFKAAEPYIGLLGLPGAIAEAYKARELKKLRAKEFCEIAFTDIVKIKKKRWGAILLILFDDKKYHAWLTSKDGAKILEKMISVTD